MDVTEQQKMPLGKVGLQQNQRDLKEITEMPDVFKSQV